MGGRGAKRRRIAARQMTKAAAHAAGAEGAPPAAEVAAERAEAARPPAAVNVARAEDARAPRGRRPEAGTPPVPSTTSWTTAEITHSKFCTVVDERGGKQAALLLQRGEIQFVIRLSEQTPPPEGEGSRATAETVPSDQQVFLPSTCIVCGEWGGVRHERQAKAPSE